MDFNPASRPRKPNLYPALAAVSSEYCSSRARVPIAREHMHTRALRGYLISRSPRAVLRATLLITFFLSGTPHLCL